MYGSRLESRNQAQEAARSGTAHTILSSKLLERSSAIDRVPSDHIRSSRSGLEDG